MSGENGLGGEGPECRAHCAPHGKGTIIRRTRALFLRCRSGSARWRESTYPATTPKAKQIHFVGSRKKKPQHFQSRERRPEGEGEKKTGSQEQKIEEQPPAKRGQIPSRNTFREGLILTIIEEREGKVIEQGIEARYQNLKRLLLSGRNGKVQFRRRDEKKVRTNTPNTVRDLQIPASAKWGSNDSIKKAIETKGYFLLH